MLAVERRTALVLGANNPLNRREIELAEGIVLCTKQTSSPSIGPYRLLFAYAFVRAESEQNSSHPTFPARSAVEAKSRTHSDQGKQESRIPGGMAV
jgi:hypothetical protein